MVGEYFSWERRTMEVMMPSFHSSNDCKKFSIIDVIVLFRWGKQLGEIGAWVPFSIGVSLKEDASVGMLGSISSQGEQFG